MITPSNIACCLCLYFLAFNMRTTPRNGQGKIGGGDDKNIGYQYRAWGLLFFNI
jgi:hypothetical protein